MQIHRYMCDVARRLLGEPNQALTKGHVWRYGTQGSLAIDVQAGTWFDHENGIGGGVLKLIERETGITNGEAFDWLRSELHVQIDDSVRQIVATFDYTDINDALLFQVVRFEPKDFRQRRPDGKGGWIWNLQGVEPVPYRLPRILEPGVVYIVEGEKDVHALERLGLLATCNPGGAGKWPMTFAQWFDGRDVVVIPDNDKPGEDHARKVAANLRDIVARVRILRLPNLPAKGDISDWIAKGGNASDLERLAEQSNETTNDAPTHRIRLTPFDDIHVGTERAYLVRGVVPDKGLTVVWGPPKCGKSFVVADIALHVALDRPWRGRDVKHGPVVYVAAEGAHGFRARIEAFRQDRLAEVVGPVPFYLVDVNLDLVAEHAELAAAINRTLPDTPPVMVVLDTLNRTMPGSESSDEDMGAYIKAADFIRETFGCAVIVVHHCGVEGKRPRGHTSLSGAVDAQIAVSRSRSDAIAATVECMKDGPEGETFTSRLRVVDVGIDEDGETITSCVVDEAEEEAPRKSGAKLNRRQQRGLDVLNELLIDNGRPSPGGSHYPDNARVVERDAWKEYLFKAGVLDPGATNPRTDFKRLKDGLLDRGAICEWNNLIWTVKGSE